MFCSSMPFATGAKGKFRYLLISGELTIDNCNQIHAEMVKAVKNDVSYVIDMSKVKSCDLSGAQLIYSLFAELERKGSLFKIRDTSEELKTILSSFSMELPQSTLEVEMA